MPVIPRNVTTPATVTPPTVTTTPNNVTPTDVTSTTTSTTNVNTSMTNGTTTFDPNAGNAAPISSGAPMAGALSSVALRAAAAGVDPVLIAKLADPAQLKATVEGFSQLLVATDGQAITPQQEKKIFDTLGALSAAGKLVPALMMLVEEAGKAGALPANLPPEKKQGLVMQFAGMVEAEIVARGANGSNEGRFTDWNETSKQLLAQVRNTAVPPKGPGNPSAFLDARFVGELEKLTESKFTAGNTITPLFNGPASFAERDKLIDNATTSIHMLSWAFYDDVTGEETTKKLIAAKQRGVDVKIMVDGNVAKQPGHDKMLAALEAAGVEVVRWNDPARPHDGQHRKCMIVDGKTAIAGGMNVGDVYSHKGPAEKPKWRDTDAKIGGPAVTDATRLFAQLWNAQAARLGLTKVSEPPAPAAASATATNGRAQVVDDAPGPKGDAHILLAALKAIEGATTRIDIENAYLITTPALQEALLAALKRGVPVRILTNSAESVDEPIVSAPILESLPSLIAAGAEVYLKQGDTLHSKFMVVDDVFSMITSYNLHPRSERYEGEVAFNAIDESLAKDMRKQFEADIAVGKRLAKPEDVVIPKTALSVLAKRFFFDQL
jgi:cardiolipin synthase A/B